MGNPYWGVFSDFSFLYVHQRTVIYYLQRQSCHRTSSLNLLPTIVCVNVRQPNMCVSVCLVYRQSVQRLTYFFNKSVFLIFLNCRYYPHCPLQYWLYKQSVPRGIAEFLLHWTSLLKLRKWLVCYADTLTWQVTYLS